MSEIKVMKNSKQEPSKGAEENYIFCTSINKVMSGIISTTNPPRILCFCNEANGKIILEAMEQYRAEGLKEELIKFMIWYNRHFDVADIQRESEKIVNDYLSNNQKP
jgi:hypothetical protein